MVRGMCAWRDLAWGGLPWIDSTTALGITVAHAADVLAFAVPAPAANQRAEAVNEYAMPLECLLCPKLRPSFKPARTSKARVAPRILRAATAIAALSTSGDRDRAWVTNDLPPAWIQPEPPSCVGSLIEGIEPRAHRDDVPDVQYFLVSDLTSPGELE